MFLLYVCVTSRRIWGVGVTHATRVLRIDQHSMEEDYLLIGIHSLPESPGSHHVRLSTSCWFSLEITNMPRNINAWYIWCQTLVTPTDLSRLPEILMDPPPVLAPDRPPWWQTMDLQGAVLRTISVEIKLKISAILQHAWSKGEGMTTILCKNIYCHCCFFIDVHQTPRAASVLGDSGFQRWKIKINIQ